MADPIDNLEKMLAGTVAPDRLSKFYSVIDEWRYTYGGERSYIARKSHVRIEEQVHELNRLGVRNVEIAERVGLTPRQVRNITSKKSSYL